MSIKDGPTGMYFRPEDIATFKRAAKLYKVYILVRRTNPASLKYVGAKGYTPKLIDCKAKTADNDVLAKGKWRKTAGLVIDCDVLKDQLGQAFDGGKTDKALKEWGSFTLAGKLAPKGIYGTDGKSINTIYPAYTYYTEMDPNHDHYGCVRHSPTTMARGGKYIHGDYDLYAVISAEAPENKFVDETRLGEKHSRSPYQMDVQNYVTAQIPGMIAHGEQDTYKSDLDDHLDAFHPDGATVEPLLGAAAIQRFYERFPGRIMRDKTTPTAGAGGLWRTT
jgi:hypothetical protein